VPVEAGVVATVVAAPMENDPEDAKTSLMLLGGGARIIQC